MGPRLKQLSKKYIIDKKDVLKILSHSDDEKLKDMAEYSLNRISKTNRYFIFLFIIYSILMGTLILDIGYKYLSTPQQVGIVIGLICVHLIESILTNRDIYYESGLISVGILNNWFAEISKYFSQKEIKVQNTFALTFKAYHYNVTEIIRSAIDSILIITTIILSVVNANLKILAMGIIVIVLTTMAITGKKWRSTAREVHNNYLKNKRTTGKTLRARYMFPSVYNLLSSTIIPVCVILLTKNNINQLIPQTALLIALANFAWSMMEISHNFEISKTNLNKINASLNRITKRYILNNAGYKKLCKLCFPNTNTLKRSKNNNSLVVKNYIPMAITNKSKVSHIYNFEFKPKVYQLNGTNGIGKTTFLESLTLPQGVRVEYSKGEVALNGEPFFDENLNLESHRKKYIYIGSDAKSPNLEQVDLKIFSEYKLITTFLKNLAYENKNKFSEGEKAIVSICHAYQEAINNGMKLIFIDESISRIYNDKTTPLRKEVIKLIYSLENTKNTIVIVVDHMTKLESATQLKMQKKLITKIN